MSFGRLGSLGNGFGRLGGTGKSGHAPSAPVLAITSASSDNTPEFTVDVDDTVIAGDSIRIQIQVSGGDWSSPVSDTNHTITAPEDAANEVDLSLTALANGTYDARALAVDAGVSSAWSNTVTFTISATPDGRLLWSTDQLLWSTDHLTWA